MAEDPVAWIDMPYRAPVQDAEGGSIGTAESLLGDESEDIFHGIAVKRKSDGVLVEIPSAQVTRITRTHVETSVAPGEVAALSRYVEQRWLHLGWGGIFRKRPEWRE
jgi:hypothetical protein